MFKKFFSQKPELKSTREIALMRESGKIVAEALQLCREKCKPGVKTIEINAAVEALFSRYGAIPLFKGYKGPKTKFPAVTCISVNEQVVHGIPGQREIRDGDLVKIDTACKLNGWCADAAVSICVGTVRPERRRLVDVGTLALRTAIDELAKRRWWSEVAGRMQWVVQNAGFSVVEAYVGHGIGRVMHEDPQVPNYVGTDTKKFDFRIEPGLVLAVEPMVNMGKAETRTLNDNWTVVTKDGMPSVHMEHTLAITANGVEIITRDEVVMPTATTTTANIDGGMANVEARMTKE